MQWHYNEYDGPVVINLTPCFPVLQDSYMWDFPVRHCPQFGKGKLHGSFFGQTLRHYNAIGFKALGVHHTDQFHFSWMRLY